MIVPVYKVEAYLDVCVASDVGQTHQELEIILVDDGSPDNCPEMCDAWAVRDPRVRVIHKPNGGLSDARNAGIGSALGSYLTFVDSDDLIAPDMIEHLLEGMKGGAQIAGVQHVSFDLTAPQFSSEGNWLFLSPDEAARGLVCERRFNWAVWGRVYHRCLFDAGLRFPVGLIYEDVAFTPRAMAAATSVAVSDAALYGYRTSSESIMGLTMRDGHSPDLLEVLDSNIDFTHVHYTDNVDLSRELSAAYVMYATKVLARTRTDSARFEPYWWAYVSFVRRNGRPSLLRPGSVRGFWALGFIAAHLPFLIKPYVLFVQSHRRRTVGVPWRRRERQTAL